MSEKTNQTLSITYQETDTSEDSCPFVLFQIPDTDIPCGYPMDIYLRAETSALLSGYTLYKEGTNLGSGSVQTESQFLSIEEEIVFSETSEVQLERPIRIIQGVNVSVMRKGVFNAQGELIDTAPYSGSFIKKGGSCVATSTGELLYGHAVVTYRPGRFYRKWQWTVDCSRKNHWFFLKKDGVIVRKFSIEVDEVVQSNPDVQKTIVIRAIEFSSEVPQENASVYINDTFKGETDEYGELDIDLYPGTYNIKITKEGFLDTDEDDISNDEIVVS